MVSKLAIALLLGLASLCLGGQTYTVYIEENAFSPEAQQINVGDTITWIWEYVPAGILKSGSNCIYDGNFESGSPTGLGYSYSHTFTNAGTFPYFSYGTCNVFFMNTGYIEVYAPPPTPAPTPSPSQCPTLAPCPVAPRAYNGAFTLYNSASSFSLGSLASSSANSFLLLSFPNPSIIEFTNVLPGQHLSTPGNIQYTFSATSVTTTSFLFVAVAGNVISNVANVTLTLN